jgi:antirestriction protein ArdC
MQKPSGEKLNIYRTVTDRIIESLKTGSFLGRSHGRHPPTPEAAFRVTSAPANHTACERLLLWSMPYTAPFWLTFKQAQELGGAVRKGEKGSSKTKRTRTKASRRKPLTRRRAASRSFSPTTLSSTSSNAMVSCCQRCFPQQSRTT